MERILAKVILVALSVRVDEVIESDDFRLWPKADVPEVSPYVGFQD